MEESTGVPLTLGRPFLATTKALIDVNDGKFVQRVGEDEIIFRLPEAMKHLLEFDDVLYLIHSFNLEISNYVQETLQKEHLKDHLG